MLFLQESSIIFFFLFSFIETQKLRLSSTSRSDSAAFFMIRCRNHKTTTISSTDSDTNKSLKNLNQILSIRLLYSCS